MKYTVVDLINALRNHNKINSMGFGVILVYDDGSCGLYDGVSGIENGEEVADLTDSLLFEFIERYK